MAPDKVSVPLPDLVSDELPLSAVENETILLAVSMFHCWLPLVANRLEKSVVIPEYCSVPPVISKLPAAVALPNAAVLLTARMPALMVVVPL